jgi:hypothetical protein
LIDVAKPWASRDRIDGQGVERPDNLTGHFCHAAALFWCRDVVTCRVAFFVLATLLPAALNH